VGELRQRTERFVTFDSIDVVERVIDRLEELGLVRRLARQAGQSQRRVKELMSDGGADIDSEQTAPTIVQENEIGSRLAALEKRFDELLRRLGVDDL
jgi:uncharacterized protein YceH (UPF0502 family)